MNTKALFASGLALLVAACDPAVDPDMVSREPAALATMAAARDAVRICGRTAPDWRSAEAALEAAGYAETTNDRLQAIQRRQGAVILEDGASDVLVLLGARGGEGACIVGAPGLTPPQSTALALPWARQFEAQTNADRGQGLANNAAEAWGTSTDERIVYIAAYKTWDVLEEAGAAARLLYIKR